MRRKFELKIFDLLEYMKLNTSFMLHVFQIQHCLWFLSWLCSVQASVSKGLNGLWRRAPVSSLQHWRLALDGLLGAEFLGDVVWCVLLFKTHLCVTCRSLPRSCCCVVRHWSMKGLGWWCGCGFLVLRIRLDVASSFYWSSGGLGLKEGLARTRNQAPAVTLARWILSSLSLTDLAFLGVTNWAINIPFLCWL